MYQRDAAAVSYSASSASGGSDVSAFANSLRETAGSFGAADAKTRSLDRVVNALSLVYVRSWERTRRFAMLIIVWEFLQLAEFLLSKLWNWDFINYKDDGLKAVFYAQLNLAAAVRGVGLFKSILIIVIVLVWIQVIILGYLSVLHHLRAVTGSEKQEFRWYQSQLINFLRILMVALGKVLFIPTFNILLTPVACDWWDRALYRSAHPPIRNGTYSHLLIYLPETKCFGPDMSSTLAIVAVATAVAHVAMGLLAELRYLDPRLVAEFPMSTFNAYHILRIFVTKVVIVIAFNITIGYRPELTTLILLICYMSLAWIIVRRAVYSNMAVQMTLTALNFVLAWTSILLFVAISFAEATNWTRIQLALWIGSPIVAAIGAFMARERKRRAIKTANKFLDPNPVVASYEMHSFKDEHEPEIVVRYFLLSANRDDPVLWQTAVMQTVRVIMAARLQWPDSAHLGYVHASFTTFQEGSIGLAHSLIEKARRSPGTKATQHWELQVMSNERQRLEVSQISGDAMDVSTFVSLQGEYKSLTRLHKAAWESVTAFWKVFLRHDIELRSIEKAFGKIEAAMRIADAQYRHALERYPKSSNLLRSYGRFLQDIRNDSGKAAKLLAEAEKLEHVASSNAAVGDGGWRIDENRDSVVIITTEGIVTFTNKALSAMFGYTRDALEGKNISVLMPPPFSAQHNGFLRSYSQTGQSKVINTVREVVAQHKQGYVFAVHIYVSKINQNQAEGFLGVIKQVPQEPNVGQLWLSGAGTVIAVSRGFSDLAGYTPENLIGRYLGSVAMDHDLMGDVVVKINELMDQELGAKETPVKLILRHRYGGPVCLNVTMHTAGTETNRLVVCSFTRDDDYTGILVLNNEGFVHFADSVAAGLISYDPAKLVGQRIDALLPKPLGVLHYQAWLQKQYTQGFSAPCLSGRTIPMRTAQGRSSYVTLRLVTDEPVSLEYAPDPKKKKAFVYGGQSDAGPAPKFKTFTMEGASHDRWVMEHRMSISVKPNGVIGKAFAAKSFDYGDLDLMGRPLSSLLVVSDHTDGPETVNVYEFLAQLVGMDERNFSAGWRMADGSITGAIIEIKRSTEEALNLDVYRLDRLDMALEVDRATGRILDVSELAHVVMGCPREELRVRTIQDLFPDALKGSEPLEIFGTMAKNYEASIDKPILSPKLSLASVDAKGGAVKFVGLAVDEGQQSIWVYLKVSERQQKGAAETAMASVRHSKSIGRQNSRLFQGRLGGNGPNGSLVKREPSRLRAGKSNMGLLGGSTSESPNNGSVPEDSDEESVLPKRIRSRNITPRNTDLPFASPLEGRPGPGASRLGRESPAGPLSGSSFPGPGTDPELTLVLNQLAPVEGVTAPPAFVESLSQLTNLSLAPPAAAPTRSPVPARPPPAPATLKLTEELLGGGGSRRRGSESSGMAVSSDGGEQEPETPQPGAQFATHDAGTGGAQQQSTGQGSTARRNGKTRRFSATGIVPSNPVQSSVDGATLGGGDATNALRKLVHQIEPASSRGSSFRGISVVRQQNGDSGDGHDDDLRAGLFTTPYNPIKPINFASAAQTVPPAPSVARTGITVNAEMVNPAMMGTLERKPSVTGGQRAAKGGNPTGDDKASDRDDASSASGDSEVSLFSESSTGGNRRFRKLYKVVNAGRTQPIMTKLLRMTRLALFIALVVQVVSFIVTIKVTQSWKSLSSISALAVGLTEQLYYSMAKCELLLLPGLVSDVGLTPESLRIDLENELDDIEANLKAIYLDLQTSSTEDKKLQDLFSKPRTRVTYRTGQVDDPVVTELMSLWTLGNTFTSNARDFVIQSRNMSLDAMLNSLALDFTADAGYHYVIPAFDNAAKLQSEHFSRSLVMELKNSITVVFIVQLVVVLPLAGIVVAYAIRKASNVKVRRYAIFQEVPRQHVYAIVVEKWKSEDFDDGDDSDGEDQIQKKKELQELSNFAAEQEKSLKAKLMMGKGKVSPGEEEPEEIRDQRLNRLVLKLMSPIVAWALLIVLILVLQTQSINHQSSLSLELYGLSKLSTAGMQVLYLVIGYTAGAVGGDNTTVFRNELMTASTSLIDNMKIISEGNATYKVPNNVLGDRRVFHALYGRHCLRLDANCDQAEAAYFGNSLDFLIRLITEESDILALEPDSAITPASPRIKFLVEGLLVDFHDGIGSLNQQFEVHAKFISTITALNSILLAGSAVLVWYYNRKFLSPTLRASSHESEILATLFARVDPALKIERTLVRKFGLSTKRKKKIAKTRWQLVRERLAHLFDKEEDDDVGSLRVNDKLVKAAGAEGGALRSGYAKGD